VAETARGKASCNCFSTRAVSKFYTASLVAVVACCGVSVIAYCIDCVFQAQQALLYDKAADACDANGMATPASLAYLDELLGQHRSFDTLYVVQSFSEAIALLVIMAAYTVLVPACVSIIRRAESEASNALLSMSHVPPDVFQLPQEYAAKGAAAAPSRSRTTDSGAHIVRETVQAAAQQRRRLLLSCIAVLITYPPRAALDFMRAYSYLAFTQNPACGQCDACQLDQYLMQRWLAYTPEFRPIAVVLSSSLPLVVSLWILTSANTRAVAILNKVPLLFMRHVFRRQKTEGGGGGGGEGRRS